MRLRLTATPEEIQEKGDTLIKALAGRLMHYAPDLGESLLKAVKGQSKDSPAADNLQYRALRQIKDVTTKEYKRQLQGMLDDIDGVLSGRSIIKKAFGDPPEKPEPGEEEPEEPLEPGDYDPKTDAIVPEPEDEEEDEEEGEEEP